jgi:DDE family transposase
MPPSRLAPLRRPHPVPPTPPSDVPSVSAVEAFLESLLGDLAEEPSGPPGRGRPRVLPALLLWGALVTCVLEGQPSQRAIWRKLADHGLWGRRGLAISDEAVYRRLARDGVAPLAQLFTQVTALLAARVQPWARAELAPWATGVYAIDESTFDPLARALPLVGAPAGQSLPHLPGKLAACFNLRTQQWERILTTAAPHQNEKVLARQLVAGLARGSLVLFDLGYFAFHWFDDLTDAGLAWVSRARDGGSYDVIQTLYEDAETSDAIVFLGAHRADRARHAVRRVCFQAAGHTRCYLTNVLDPAQLSLYDIAALYARRWDIERAFALVKRALGLHLWWSRKPVVLQQQLWAVLLISQILQALRLEIAGRAEVDPFEVSMAMLVEQLPQYLARGWDPVARFVAVGRRMGYIRPSRRVCIRAPSIPLAAYQPLDPALALTRTPRYAERDSLHRPARGI